ncbi:MAG: ferrochelatase [Hyphomonadaceae bacterium]|nr:ferrochelatase [Hyphomonadaceae bacterium]
MGRRIAIVLFNLGGPDGPDAVRPFLRNLFSDPAIIQAPAPVRWFLARLISTLRNKSAMANYAKMGGGSPLVPETVKQADALKAALKADPATRGDTVEVFLAMRYWHPLVEEAVKAVKAFGADEVILLPLYPQFSTTTTRSSLDAWTRAGGPQARVVCCYPDAPGFIQAHADAVMEAWTAAGKPLPARVLWSAHGLPKKVVDAGDPYQRHVEETVRAIIPLLPPELDHVVCFQSRVGPLEWIGPATEAEVERAAADGIGVIVSPVAFVSEHIETLVELDEEYRELADELGVPFYLRAPALGTRQGFIDTLVDMVTRSLASTDQVIAGRSGSCEVQCPACPRTCTG